MPGLQAGTMRHKVTLLRPVVTLDEYGQESRHWEPVGECWADITGGGGGTTVVLDHVSVKYTHTLRIRQCSAIAGISPLWRVGFRGNQMEIGSVIDPNNDGFVWEISCTEERPNNGGPR